MKFNTAYDTTACSGFVMKKTIDALQVARINSELQPLGGSFPMCLVQGGGAAADNVPAFAHPLTIPDTFTTGHNKSDVLALDVRSYGKWDNEKREFVIRNTVEHTFAIWRLKLNAVWLKESTNALRDVSGLPMAVFASWISEEIARRFALDAREQFTLAILAGVFYNSLFLDKNVTELDEKEKLRVVNAVSRNLRASGTDVMEVVDQVSVIHNVGDFCAAAASVTKSIRLAELNKGVLATILSNTWFGTNAKETIVVALEHPPTWLTVLLSALTERTYKNSRVAKVAERSAGREGGGAYIRAIQTLVSVTIGE